MTDECRRTFERWCLSEAGYQPEEVMRDERRGFKYPPAIESDWITWQAAWNARRSPDARGEVEKVCAEMESATDGANDETVAGWAARLRGGNE